MMAGVCLWLVYVLPNTGAEGLLSYQEPGSGTPAEVTLYFRFLDSPYLGQERRAIQVKRTQNLEQALVQALLDGPKGAEGYYQPLFPEGTKVLNVLEEGGRLFVSLSREVMNPLPGEDNSPLGKENAVLRRRLALSSLVNTLTEQGGAQSVQVLVMGEPGPEQSLRLSMRYYLEDSDLLPEPLTRQEEDILTPGKAAETIFQFWKQRRWSGLQSLLAFDSGQGENPKADFYLDFPVLTSLSASKGSISPDGGSAVVILDLGFLTNAGQEKSLKAYPVRLLRGSQGWKLAFSSLTALLEAAK